MSESKQEWLQRVADLHGLDTEDIEEIAELCVEDTATNISNLLSLSPNGDLETGLRAAHSIKGSAANLGQTKISNAAKVLEAQLRVKNFTDLEHNINILQAAFKEFKELVGS
jgi:HPt (histidine-containing phosphotransfer) domain-containing protein